MQDMPSEVPSGVGVHQVPPEEKCVHRWVVTNPRSQFSRSLARGDLVETTDQYCKNCEATRLNNVVIPPERVGNAHSELSEIYR